MAALLVFLGVLAIVFLLAFMVLFMIGACRVAGRSDEQADAIYRSLTETGEADK